MAVYELEIPGKFPGLNDFIHAQNTHRMLGANLKRDSQAEISKCITFLHPHIHIEKPIIIHYAYYEPNKKRDHDNVSGFFHKVFQDALVETGVIEDDGWKYISGYTDMFYVDKQNPKIKVTLEEQ